MKKYATILAFLVPLLGPAMEARAEAVVGVETSFDASFTLAQMRPPIQPPVQTAPPAERPYGRRSTPRLPYGVGAPPTQGRYATYAGYTELRIVPAYGGIAWVYDGETLVGSIEARPGALFVPEGRAYGVVMTRGDRTVWQGQVLATPGVVAVSLDRFGAPIVERMPPPPSRSAPSYAPDFERPFSAIQFRSALADLETLPDDRSRLAFLSDVFGSRGVTVGQAHDLLSRLAFEETRLQALSRLAPALVGRGDTSRLLDMFFTYEARARASALLRFP